MTEGPLGLQCTCPLVASVRGSPSHAAVIIEITPHTKEELLTSSRAAVELAPTVGVSLS